MSRRRLIGLLITGIIFCLLAIEAQANIILKTVIVNPSKTKTQTALLKVYLPKEAANEDVVDLGDLEIDYDIEKGLYFVYQEYELKPGESINREIEIKDVWVIPEEDVGSLPTRAKELAERLRGTAYFDMAVTLQKDIESKAMDILERQKEAMVVPPQAHIGVYRKNIKILDLTNAKLTKLEKMAAELKITDITDSPKDERIYIKATWKLIIAMIAALGILSFAFFIIWNRQAAIENK